MRGAVPAGGFQPIRTLSWPVSDRRCSATGGHGGLVTQQCTEPAGGARNTVSASPAAVFPDLVVYNEEGQPETVKYRLLSTLLLNELQKQSSLNESQNIELARLHEQSQELKVLQAEVAELKQLQAMLVHLQEAALGPQLAALADKP